MQTSNANLASPNRVSAGQPPRPAFPRTLGLIAAAALLPPFLLRADTAQLRPVADTTLIEAAAGNNLGANPFFNVGTTENRTRNRGLVQFDFNGFVPQNAIIEQVQLELTVVGIPANGFTPTVVGIYRVLAPWAEGDQFPSAVSPGLGAPADTGEATWSHRHFGTQDTWTVPGGEFGSDFTLSASSVEFIDAEDTYLFDTTPRFLADVQAMVDNPNDNYGWAVVAFSEDLQFTARRFASREDPDFAPLLTVTYQVVPEPSVWALAVVAVLLGAWRPRHS